MKHLNLLWLTLTMSFTSVAQKEVSVLSSQGEAVPYANITYLMNGSVSGGTYTNANGMALLNFGEDITALEISHLNFKKLKVDVKDIDDIIYLEENPKVLEEITLNFSAEPDFLFTGVKRLPKRHTFSAHEGFEWITLMRNDFGEKKRIKSFIFHTRRWTRKRTLAIKVVFYSNENNTPGARLPVEVVVELDRKNKKEVMVDLQDENLFLPENGVFAGVEWIGCPFVKNAKDDDPHDCSHSMIYVPMNEEQLKDHPTFFRYRYTTEEWRSKQFVLEAYLVPAFGLEVFE